MNPPQVYLCSPSWTLFPPPSPYPPSGSSQCTSPKHPVSCIEPGLVTRFIHDILHFSMPFSQISPPSPSPTESIRLIYTSVSLLLSRTQGYCYHLSKFRIYALVYCIGVFLSGLLFKMFYSKQMYCSEMYHQCRIEKLQLCFDCLFLEKEIREMLSLIRDILCHW